MEELKQVTVA